MKIVIEDRRRLCSGGALSLAAILLLMFEGGAYLSAPPKGVPAIGTDKVVQFLRDRYGIPQRVRISMDPFQSSTFAGFSEANVTMGEGQQQKSQKVYVTEDGRYVVLGTLVELGKDPGAELIKQVRESFKLPNTMKLKAGPLEKSKFAEFQQMKVFTDDGKSQDFFVKGGGVAVFGDLELIDMNLRRKALETMVLRDQPSVGPANAPVTIVEYADLQCPVCSRFHSFLESELLPRYGDKVRVVFKEFPLPIHDWSTTGAIADQCAYEISPARFEAFRSSIFRHQDAISPSNAEEALLQYAQEDGLDRGRLAACIESKASLPRVEENKREGEKLGINSTPTSFINGRIVVGVPEPDQYFALVDEELHAAKPH